MNYKNYTIEPDNTGYAPKNMTFGIFKEEEYIGSCETVEECKKLINENLLENFEWTDKSVIDFVNWFKIPEIGMRIKCISNSPRIESHGYVFCGTWKGIGKGEYELIHPSWQNKITGEVITNEEFLYLALTC